MGHGRTKPDRCAWLWCLKWWARSRTPCPLPTLGHPPQCCTLHTASLTFRPRCQPRDHLAQGPVPGLPGATQSHPPRAMPGGANADAHLPYRLGTRARTWQALNKQCWVKGDASAKRPHARHKPWSAPGALREKGGQGGTQCASERQLEPGRGRPSQRGTGTKNVPEPGPLGRGLAPTPSLPPLQHLPSFTVPSPLLTCPAPESQSPEQPPQLGSLSTH